MEEQKRKKEKKEARDGELAMVEPLSVKSKVGGQR